MTAYSALAKPQHKTNLTLCIDPPMLKILKEIAAVKGFTLNYTIRQLLTMALLTLAAEEAEEAEVADEG